MVGNVDKMWDIQTTEQRDKVVDMECFSAVGHLVHMVFTDRWTLVT